MYCLSAGFSIRFYREFPQQKLSLAIQRNGVETKNVHSLALWITSGSSQFPFVSFHIQQWHSRGRRTRNGIKIPFGVVAKRTVPLLSENDGKNFIAKWNKTSNYLPLPKFHNFLICYRSSNGKSSTDKYYHCATIEKHSYWQIFTGKKEQFLNCCLIFHSRKIYRLLFFDIKKYSSSIIVCFLDILIALISLTSFSPNCTKLN